LLAVVGIGQQAALLTDADMQHGVQAGLAGEMATQTFFACAAISYQIELQKRQWEEESGP
jgi:hypothetical protein